MNKLSVVLATRNEENNIVDCLEAVKGIADEVIVVDETSEDRTRELAKGFGAKVFKVKHEEIFHKTKQKALNKASGDWILQLDADEIVTPQLAQEIKEIISLSNEQIKSRRPDDGDKWQLFEKHKKAYERMYGRMGEDTGEIVAFLLPRLNYFVGKPLIHAGVYPDPAIRLVKKGKAHFPAKSVHENMQIDGEVAWLFNDLEHRDSPSIKRYIMRMNRYTELQSEEFVKNNLSKNLITLLYYSSIKPLWNFILLYYRHGGYKDKLRGFLWSAFSSMHFPMAYYKYWTKGYTK